MCHSTQPEKDTQELVLSFCYVGLRDRTQAIGLGNKCLYPLNRLTGFMGTVLNNVNSKP